MQRWLYFTEVKNQAPKINDMVLIMNKYVLSQKKEAGFGDRCLKVLECVPCEGSTGIQQLGKSGGEGTGVRVRVKLPGKKL